MQTMFYFVLLSMGRFNSKPYLDKDYLFNTKRRNNHFFLIYGGAAVETKLVKMSALGANDINNS